MAGQDDLEPSSPSVNHEMMTDNIQRFRKKINHVREQIKSSALKAGRDPASVKLLVVTKEKPAQVVKQLFDAGQTIIGESYVQEASFKMELLSDFDIEWHMVGHIQSGKAKFVAAHFSCVHSLDRLGLAEDLNQAAEANERILPVYLECNVSGEESKHGWKAWDETTWGHLAEKMKPVLSMSHLDVRGLMTMAPYHQDPEHARPFFVKLRRLSAFLSRTFPERPIEGLSMGMSADYGVAVEEGATIVRVGSAIVGPRQ